MKLIFEIIRGVCLESWEESKLRFKITKAKYLL